MKAFTQRNDYNKMLVPSNVFNCRLYRNTGALYKRCPTAVGGLQSAVGDWNTEEMRDKTLKSC
jgi:hypothetical protein